MIVLTVPEVIELLAAAPFPLPRDFRAFAASWAEQEEAGRVIPDWTLAEADGDVSEAVALTVDEVAEMVGGWHDSWREEPGEAFADMVLGYVEHMRSGGFHCGRTLGRRVIA